MPQLLLADNQKYWAFFHRLMIDLLTFIAPQIQTGELKETTRVIYKATMRVFLVLLHDFPEFLCGYHHSLVDALPQTCIQLKNLILSAFPPDMRLPDPFTPNLKVDLLPEINENPKTLSDYTSSLENAKIKTDLDLYLKNRAPVSFLDNLSYTLLSKNAIDGNRYDVSLMNSLVLYVGIQAIQKSQKTVQGPPPVAHNVSMDIFQHLLVDLDSEGRYIFLGAIANQLRYPNSHTHYFSCVLLYLFSESTLEIMQEQITRVLIERLIVSRPHPYGLLITFIELIRNPKYSFWEHKSFINSSPEIERLFQNVAKSMSQTIPVVQAS
jgi:CCR4-NOT transcription complex subunit 1